jgi:hypothetical protein
MVVRVGWRDVRGTRRGDGEVVIVVEVRGEC